MYHIFLIHCSIDGHLSYLQVFTPNCFLLDNISKDALLYNRSGGFFCIANLKFFFSYKFINHQERTDQRRKVQLLILMQSFIFSIAAENQTQYRSIWVSYLYCLLLEFCSVRIFCRIFFSRTLQQVAYDISQLKFWTVRYFGLCVFLNLFLVAG